MEPDKLARFKTILERLIAQLDRELNAGHDMTAVVSLDDPIGRLSRIDALQAQEIALGLKAGTQRRYDMARRALAAVENGTYGVCVGCHNPISDARLEALPETSLCVECSA